MTYYLFGQVISKSPCVALFSVYQNKSEFDKNTNMLEDARHSFFLLRQLSWLLLFWKLVTSLEDVNERKWKCQSQLSWQIFLFLSSFVILKKNISFASFERTSLKWLSDHKRSLACDFSLVWDFWLCSRQYFRLLSCSRFMLLDFY